VHKGDHVLYKSGFFEADVSVTHEGNLVSLSSDYSVDYVTASYVFDKNHCAFPDVLIFPWTEDKLIAHMHDERVHAVAFGGYGYGLAFRNQSADFFHHYSLFFDNHTHSAPKISKKGCIRTKFLIFERFMENTYKYTVAGHTFCVILPEGFSGAEHLKPYEPFVETGDVEPLFTLELKTVSRLREKVQGRVRECLNDEAPYFWIFEDENGSFSFGFSYTKSHPDCILITSEDYKSNVVYISEAMADRYAEFALSNAMMLLYTFCTSPSDTLMVHASVIAHDGGGYMFLGRSGTGKSTHSRLWLNHIDDTYLLNDDNPVIRFMDGQAYVYGTPWSGKTPCYKNESMPLKAVVRLSQAPYNKIVHLAPLQSFASLMPACSCMRWDGRSVAALHSSVEKVIGVVPCWHLECLPDEAAAVLCNSTVKR
jgi:hypothetical protein